MWDMNFFLIHWKKSACKWFSDRIKLPFKCVCVLQRIDSRLSLLQSAVDEYNKAKNDFAAKVNLWKNSFSKMSMLITPLPPSRLFVCLFFLLSSGHRGWDATPGFSTKNGWGESNRTTGSVFTGKLTNSSHSTPNNNIMFRSILSGIHIYNAASVK